MAGINQIPGVPQQIRLIAHLRWMLFKNSLRNVKGRLEAVSSAILWLMMTGIVLGGAVFMGIATYFLVSETHWARLALLTWIIFLFWQLYPIFAATVGAQFDFSNLLRFPLRFSSFFALSLIYGLFDPGAVASCVWLFCMWIGLGIARPATLPWALIVLLAFAAINLFFARMLLAWIDKWLARRRSREILGFIFILIIICVQLIGPALTHFQNRHGQLHPAWLLTLLPIANALPPGLASRALLSGLAANFASAAQSLLFLVLYAAAFFWLLRIRLVAQYRGENLSETSAIARPAASARKIASPSAANAVASSWEIPGLSRPVAAIFEKEIRYTMRSGIMLLNFIIPVLLIIVLAISPHRTHGHDDFFRRAPQMIFPMAIAYTLLIQTNWVFNCFAFESTGIQFLLLAPVRFRDIMLGKNLFLGLASAIEALLVWAAVTLLFAPPPLVMVAASFAALLYATIANFAIGNILSISYPRRLEFGVFRQKKQAGVTVFFGLITQAVLIGLGALVIALTQTFHHPILAVPIFLTFAVLASIGYRISLGRIDALAMSHRETLTAELCRQE
jgi:ABC-2 type transport system permease protein